MVPGGGAPPIPSYTRMVKKAIGGHNWDNDSYDGDNDGDELEWAVELANHITGDDSGGHHFGGDGGYNGGGDGGGGDGGCGGGGDGGGGE